MIGYESAGGVSLDAIFSTIPINSRVALKIDIEGAEYRILNQIVRHQTMISGLAIEFHDVDLHRQRISDFIQALTELEPVWVHGNNYGGVDPQGDPIVLEMSFAQVASRVSGAGVQPRTSPNDPTVPEILLRFA